MLGGGWGVQRRAPPSLEAMCACSSLQDLRHLGSGFELGGIFKRKPSLVPMEACASSCHPKWVAEVGLATSGAVQRFRIVILPKHS